MFEETDSLFNTEAVPSNILYTNPSKLRIITYMQNFNCDHKNFDSVKLYILLANSTLNLIC